MKWLAIPPLALAALAISIAASAEPVITKEVVLIPAIEKMAEMEQRGELKRYLSSK